MWKGNIRQNQASRQTGGIRKVYRARNRILQMQNIKELIRRSSREVAMKWTMALE
jgi:hypothetical protein